MFQSCNITISHLLYWIINTLPICCSYSATINMMTPETYKVNKIIYIYVLVISLHIGSLLKGLFDANGGEKEAYGDKDILTLTQMAKRLLNK